MPDTATADHWYVVDTFHAGVQVPNTLPSPHDSNINKWSKRWTDDEVDDVVPPRRGGAGRIADILGQMHREGREMQIEMGVTKDCKLRYRVVCARYDGPSGSDISTKRVASARAELHVWLEGRVRTILFVELRWINQGAGCWLNVQASPTTLLVGGNAFAAKTGLDPDRERLYLYRYPFLLLGRILRAVDRTFAWSDDAAACIKAGAFKLHNAQLAFYMPFASRAELRRFLRWLDAVFCTPIVTGTWSSRTLGKYLRLNVESWPDARGCPTGVMLRAYRNAARNSDLTTNFYDKAATLKKAGRAALGGPRRDWLLRHLRVDVTLHPPAIGRLFTAAGLAGEPCTVSTWCRALAQLDGKEDRFREWLTHEALERRLRLRAVAGFDIDALQRARDRLSGRPRLMAVWDDWLAGKGGLRQLLHAQVPDGAAVRAEISAVRKAGLDPDLPPPILHRLAMISSLWGFSKAQAREYAEALASEDMRALHRLLRHNQTFIARTRVEFSRAVDAAFHPAPVPTIDAW